MIFLLELTQEAKLDVQEAWLWYEEKQVGLGDDFLVSLETSINHITHNPLLFEIKFQDLHVAPVKRFPYKIIYYLQENRITVIAVFHTSRNPTIWEERVHE